MKLMGLNCPNCNGPLKMVKEGTFYCANCDSAFMADFDKEDAEVQKMKLEAEIRKLQLDQAQSNAEAEKRKEKDRFRAKMIRTAIITVIALIIVVPSVIFSIREMTIEAEARRQQQIESEARRQQEEKEKEETRRLEKEAEEAAREAARQAELESYRITPEDIAGDEFFVENAKQALLGQLRNNTNLFYDDWTWNEDPEYITSYLLFAKDENARKQNVLISVYKVHWAKELDDSSEYYEIYDGACLYNIKKNGDGTLRSDYDPDNLSYHSELIRNQFLSGYEDYDQLIRQEVYGSEGYEYLEFTMP